MYKKDLAFNNLECLISYKTEPKQSHHCRTVVALFKRYLSQCYLFKSVHNRTTGVRTLLTQYLSPVSYPQHYRDSLFRIRKCIRRVYKLAER